MCVYWNERGGYDNAVTFFETLDKCSKTYGIKIYEPFWLELGDSRNKEKTI